MTIIIKWKKKQHNKVDPITVCGNRKTIAPYLEIHCKKEQREKNLIYCYTQEKAIRKLTLVT